jgi:hypothetical protein
MALAEDCARNLRLQLPETIALDLATAIGLAYRAVITPKKHFAHRYLIAIVPALFSHHCQSHVQVPPRSMPNVYNRNECISSGPEHHTFS